MKDMTVEEILDDTEDDDRTGELNNDDRAENARVALCLFLERRDGGIIDSEFSDEDASDLICDLLHLAYAHEGDVKSILRCAITNFYAELVDESGMFLDETPEAGDFIDSHVGRD